MTYASRIREMITPYPEKKSSKQISCIARNFRMFLEWHFKSDFTIGSKWRHRQDFQRNILPSCQSAVWYCGIG